MNSCIYEGVVFHDRRNPVVHRFRKSVYLFYLDLAELDEVFGGRWAWGLDRWALATFRRRDFLPNPSLPLVDHLYQTLDRLLPADSPWQERLAGGSVRLLTQVRHFGLLFNPISLYFCQDAEDSASAIVAEVTNTPWQERHCYALPADDRTKEDLLVDARSAKEFHVSPFMPMHQEYHWKISRPEQQLNVTIESHENGKLKFTAGMQLRRVSIRTSTLNWMLLKHPLMPHQIMLSIYWNALRLKWKGCPFFPHPDRLAADSQRTSRRQGMSSLTNSPATQNKIRT